MTMSDPIADMLTRIRNANTAKHDTVDVPSSKMKLAIAQILLDEGYIKKFDVVDDGAFKTIHITLKYGADKSERIITEPQFPDQPRCHYGQGSKKTSGWRRSVSICLVGNILFCDFKNKESVLTHKL